MNRNYPDDETLRLRTEIWNQKSYFWFGDDENLEPLIIDTCVRLPEEVREFVIERCRILSVGCANFGMTLPGELVLDPSLRTSGGVDRASEAGDLRELVQQKTWLILLDERIAQTKNIKGLENARSIIAHEIAHAWLGHDRHSPDCPVDCEVDTANLTKQWGFEGIGADPIYCNSDRPLTAGGAR